MAPIFTTHSLAFRLICAEKRFLAVEAQKMIQHGLVYLQHICEEPRRGAFGTGNDIFEVTVVEK